MATFPPRLTPSLACKIARRRCWCNSHWRVHGCLYKFHIVVHRTSPRLVVYIPKSMYYSTYSLGVFGMYTTILEIVYILKYGCIHTINMIQHVMLLLSILFIQMGFARCRCSSRSYEEEINALRRQALSTALQSARDKAHSAHKGEHYHRRHISSYFKEKKKTCIRR